MNTSVQQSLLSSMEDAAFQREFLRLRQNDLAPRTDSDGSSFYLKLHYAVDANVFDLFCNPGKKSYDLARRVGAGAVFRSDTPERMTSIAASIASYLFYRLTGSEPLIALLPVNEEIARIVSFYSQQRSLRINKTSDHLKTLVTAAIRDDGRVDKNELKTIRDALLVDQSYKAVFRRIQNLLQEGRLGSSAALADTQRVDEILCDALMPAADEKELSTYTRIAIAWEMALKKSRFTEKKKPVKDTDVEALTRLTLANERLRSWTGDRERLMYLTMDARLFEAGELFYEELGQIEDTTFSERYLRHPRSYLDEEGVLLPPESGEHDGEAPKDWITLIDWLDLLLGHVNDEGGDSSVNGGLLDQRRPIKTRSVEDRNSIYPENFLKNIKPQKAKYYRYLLERDRWGKYQAAQSYDLPDPLLKTIEDGLDGDYHRFIASMRELLVQIGEEQSTAWNELFKVNVEARFLLQSGSDNQRARHVPLLFFEGHAIFEEFTKRVKTWQSSPSTLNVDTYVQLRDALLTEDDSGYGYYLAHSYLLALEGQWASAAILAARAREVSANFRTEKPDGPNGREAVFFEAHCLRRAGADGPQLGELLGLVHDAKEIFRREVANAPTGFRHDVIEERYDAELLAIELTTALLAWWKAAPAQKSQALEGASILVDRYWSLYESAKDHLGNLSQRGEEKSYRAELLNQLTRRTLCNIAAIGLQVESRRSSAENAWRKLKEIPSGELKNYFAKFVYNCCKCLFGESPAERVEAKAVLQKLSTPRARERNRVFAYDTERFNDMRAKCAVAR